MRRFSVTCLGVGDGFPCADRNHASFLYQMGRTSVLLDCGESVDSRFQALGVDYGLMDAIFISHLHADHVGGFFMLMQGCWLQNRQKELPVYLPGNAIRPMREMLKAGLLFDELLKFKLRFNPLQPEKAIQVGDIRITAFPTTHLRRFRESFGAKHRGVYDSYSFLLEQGRLHIGHSADLGRPEDLEPLLSRPLDLLVCELAHFTPEALFGYLHGRRIKQVAFVHLARVYWADLPRIRRLAAKMLPDLPHSFPRDDTIIAG